MISPYILDLGFFRLHWYGAMYILAFATVLLLVLYRLQKESWKITKEQVYDLLTWGILGVLLGGRLGYVLFYNFSYYLSHPAEIIWPFQDGSLVGLAGMSYHGGLIGAVLFMWWKSKKLKINFKEVIRLFIPAVPLGYTFGRIGNFVNNELFGRVTEFPLAMNFGDGLLRHPSQLYEAFFEGIILFIFLWLVRKKEWAQNRLLGLYIIGYALARFFIEYTREPDSHLGFIIGSLTMGQLLSIAMIAIGIYVLKEKKDSN